jgi:hypothetical protein
MTENTAAGSPGTEPAWQEVARSFLDGRLRGVSVTALHDHVGEVLGPGNGPSREDVRRWLLDGEARGEIAHPAFQVWRLAPEAAQEGPHWHDVMTRVIESVHPSRLALGAWVDLAAEELGDPSFRERLDRRELATWVSAEVAGGRVDCGGWPITTYGHVPQEKAAVAWQVAVTEVLLSVHPSDVDEDYLFRRAAKLTRDLPKPEEVRAWLRDMARRDLVQHTGFRHWKARRPLLPAEEVLTEQEEMRTRVHVGRTPWAGPGSPARRVPQERSTAIVKASVRMAQHALNNDWTAFELALAQVTRMHGDWAQ